MAAVIAGVLCSVAEPVVALREVARVLRSRGELRFYEHVEARNPRLRRFQHRLDASFWPRTFGGCRPSRNPLEAFAASEFTVETYERFSFRPTLVATPIAPRILGRALMDTQVTVEPRHGA